MSSILLTSMLNSYSSSSVRIKLMLLRGASTSFSTRKCSSYFIPQKSLNSTSVAPRTSISKNWKDVPNIFNHSILIISLSNGSGRLSWMISTISREDSSLHLLLVQIAHLSQVLRMLSLFLVSREQMKKSSLLPTLVSTNCFFPTTRQKRKWRSS